MFLILKNNVPFRSFKSTDDAVACIKSVGGWNIWRIMFVDEEGAVQIELEPLLYPNRKFSK